MHRVQIRKAPVSLPRDVDELLARWASENQSSRSAELVRAVRLRALQERRDDQRQRAVVD